MGLAVSLREGAKNTIKEGGWEGCTRMGPVFGRTNDTISTALYRIMKVIIKSEWF